MTNAIAIAVIVGCLTACLFRLTSLNTQNIIYVRGEARRGVSRRHRDSRA